MLCEVADAHVVAEFARARLQRQHARQQFEQGGFARAVRANQHRALTALGFEIQFAIHHQIAVGVIHLGEPNCSHTAARRLRKAKVHGLFPTERRFNLLHPVDLLELALRLRRFAGLGPETIGESLQVGDLPLLIFVSRHLLLLARRFFPHIIIPVPAVAVQAPMRDLDDGIDQRVQEFAVMRNHQDGAARLLEMLLKPAQRLEIEMVRRFVEEE